MSESRLLSGEQRRWHSCVVALALSCRWCSSFSRSLDCITTSVCLSVCLCLSRFHGFLNILSFRLTTRYTAIEIRPLMTCHKLFVLVLFVEWSWSGPTSFFRNVLRIRLLSFIFKTILYHPSVIRDFVAIDLWTIYLCNIDLHLILRYGSLKLFK